MIISLLLAYVVARAVRGGPQAGVKVERPQVQRGRTTLTPARIHRMLTPGSTRRKVLRLKS